MLHKSWHRSGSSGCADASVLETESRLVTGFFGWRFGEAGMLGPVLWE